MDATIKQLQHALALSEYLNYRAAAASLGITQAALTHSIQKLEAGYGATLFARTGTGAHPTEQGIIVLEAARRIVQTLDDSRRDVNVDIGLRAPTLTIACDPYLSHALLSPIFADGRLQAEKKSFTVETGPWQQFRQDVIDRRVHAYIGFPMSLNDKSLKEECYDIPVWDIFMRKVTLWPESAVWT